MKILAFGASNSKSSINHQFACYVAQQFPNPKEVNCIEIRDYPLPVYSIDLEQEEGIPINAIAFHEKIMDSDLIVISLAVHNGTYTAGFKNLLDWMSRHQSKTFENKHFLLLSTSPGGRGGRGVMDAALTRFPIHGAKILNHFCLPFFEKNFNETNGIIDPELSDQFRVVLREVIDKVRI